MFAARVRPGHESPRSRPRRATPMFGRLTIVAGGSVNGSRLSYVASGEQVVACASGVADNSDRFLTRSASVVATNPRYAADSPAFE